MSDFEEAREFGVVEIDSNRPCCVMVYLSPGNFRQITTAGQPSDAVWSGSSIIITMENGTKRRYHGLGSSDYQQMFY